MSDVQLTFYCSAPDIDPLVDALRARSTMPVHIREEQVRGRDFGDAQATEQVMGRLRRMAIDLVVPADDTPALVDLVRAAKRTFPVRWQSTPLLARGRFD